MSPSASRFPTEPGHVHCASILYDFAVDGGEVGEDALPGIVPANAIILNSIVHILEDLVGAGASVGLKIGDTSLVAVEEISGWNEGLKVTDLFAPGDYDPVLLVEDSTISIVIEDEVVTAGSFVVHFVYVISTSA